MPSPVVTLDLFPQDTTSEANKIRDLTMHSGVSCLEGERILGDGRLTLPIGHADATAALADAPRVVRYKLDGVVVFEAYVLRAQRSLSDEDGGLVSLSGPSTRIALSAGLVGPYGNCPPTPDTTQRILGYQDPGFDISGLPNCVEFGLYRYQQAGNFFGDDRIRAEGIADPGAAFIADTTGPATVGEVLYFSPTFTVDEDGDYIMQVCADDEYDSFLIGSLIGSSRGKYQWVEADDYLVSLCTGVNYRWVIRGNNLSTDQDGTTGNLNWVIGDIVPAAPDGTPLAANEIWHVATNAEAGSFTLRPLISPTAATIDFDDSATDVQTKIAALTGIGATNVTVTGAGTSAKNDAYDFWTAATTSGVFRITVDAEQTGDIAWNASAATIEAAVEALTTVTDVTVSGSGTAGSPWRMEFVGTDAETGFSVSFQDISLDGTLESAQVSEGTPYDPWIIEFVGILNFTNMYEPVIDDSGLTGGEVEFDRSQSGAKAVGIIKTSPNWRCIAHPATPRGLTPGHMIRIVIEEAQARGVTILDLVTLDFTDTLDSNGEAWATEYELAINPWTTSIAEVVAFLEMSGLKVRMAPGYVLQVFQTTGFDRTATVDLSNARFAGDTTFSREKEIANVLYSQTNDDAWIPAIRSSSITTHGRWEVPYSAPDGPEITVGSWQQLALNASADPYSEHDYYTAAETHEDGTTDPNPYDDFDWGDGILGQDILGQAVEVYVTARGFRVVDDNEAVEYRVKVVEGDVSTLPTP